MFQHSCETDVRGVYDSTLPFHLPFELIGSVLQVVDAVIDGSGRNTHADVAVFGPSIDYLLQVFDLLFEVFYSLLVVAGLAVFLDLVASLEQGVETHDRDDCGVVLVLLLAEPLLHVLVFCIARWPSLYTSRWLFASQKTFDCLREYLYV